MPRFTRKLLVGLATLATASALSVNPAQAAPWNAIYNPNSGRCLGIANGLAGVWNCTTNPDQTWHWGTSSSYPYYRHLVNGNGQCLGVQGGSTAQGARVVAWTCLNHDDQYWNWYNSYSYNYYGPVTNLNSAMVLGVYGTANGAAVVQWGSNGNYDQAWEINF
jgi:hypothetical protein